MAVEAAQEILKVKENLARGGSRASLTYHHHQHQWLAAVVVVHADEIEH